MHRSAPAFTGFSRFRVPNSRYGGFDWDLCTVLYFGHRGDRLKAVFDPAESPLQAALPQR